jgi:hypothetical protein
MSFNLSRQARWLSFTQIPAKLQVSRWNFVFWGKFSDWSVRSEMGHVTELLACRVGIMQQSIGGNFYFDNWQFSCQGVTFASSAVVLV